MNDLTVSNVERQNVLNNRYAVDALQENLGFTGMLFEGEYRFTKKMVADFYEVDLSTINRYISQNEEELKYNGYFLCRGKLLKELKLQFGHVMNEMTKTTQLGLFSFRAVLNMGMLLTESEKAKQVRARILDIVISTINKRAGGGTKYINTRDIDFLPAAIEEDNYRKNFTTAVGGGIRKVLTSCRTICIILRLLTSSPIWSSVYAPAIISRTPTNGWP